MTKIQKKGEKCENAKKNATKCRKCENVMFSYVVPIFDLEKFGVTDKKNP